MYVAVSLKINLDATARLSQKVASEKQEEWRVLRITRTSHSAHRRAAETLPAMWKRQVQAQGTKHRVLLASFGRVEVPLKLLRCQGCRQLFRPAEDCLAEVKGHNVLLDLQDLTALVGSACPYETAAGVLARLSGVQLSDERLRQRDLRTGKRAGQAATRASSNLVLREAVNMEQIRAQRAQSDPEGKLDHPDWLHAGGA